MPDTRDRPDTPHAPERRVYLDHAATTPLRAEVARAMRPFLEGEGAGNPSALHAEGRAAREALEAARARILRAAGGEEFDLVFLSGGTEADHAALAGRVLAAGTAGRARAPAEVVTSAVEHPAVLNARGLLEALGARLSVVGVDREGRVDPDDVEAAVGPATVLVSIMAANNETGVLQPVAEIGSRLRRRGVAFHSDAVQLLGKAPFDLGRLGADLVTVSAHKLHGPRGVAGLFVRRGTALEPLLRGGSQEGGLRAGTENVAAAVGFAAAVDLALGEAQGEGAPGREPRGEEPRRVGRLRDDLRERLLERFPWIVENTPRAGALSHFLNLSFPRIEGESLVRLLDAFGVAASTGSACNVGARKPSHVLRAMGRSEREVRGSLRLSFGRANREGDVDLAFARLERAVEQLEALAPAAG